MFSAFETDIRNFGDEINTALANNDAAALRQAILNSAIDGPQKYGMLYFRYYFAQPAANRFEHPLLGNLTQLAEDIEELDPPLENGINFVSMEIRKCASYGSESSSLGYFATPCV